MMSWIKKIFGFDLDDEVENGEVETDDSEETKYAITITDEIACEHEKKLHDLVKYQTDTLGDHQISQETLRQKFKEISGKEFPTPEKGSIAAG